MKKFFLLALIGSFVVMASLMAGQITDKAAKAIDVYQLRKELVYRANHTVLGSAGLASATKYITVTGTPTAIINGEFITLTATSTVSFSSDSVSIAASKYCVFAIGVDEDGAYTTKQSPQVSYENQLVLPMFDNGTALIGKLQILTGSTDAFVPGTDSITTASITATITNMGALPLSLNINQR